MKKKASIFMLLGFAVILLLDSCKKTEVRPASHKCNRDSSQTTKTDTINN
jgi:hypothetical protein